MNAKYHEKEAEIIAQAGRNEAVTIATNMAGRGTDIVLGGNPEGLGREILSDKKDYTDEEWKQALTKAEDVCKKDREKVLSAEVFIYSVRKGMRREGSTISSEGVPAAG